MQSPSKKTKSMNSCENIGLECENSIKRLDVEQQKSKKIKEKILQKEDALNKLRAQNMEKKKELEDYNKKVEKLKRKQEMIPLIQQLKEHFKQLREQLGSGSLYEDDDVDVDEMSYEELLDLGQKIGKVSKGASEEQFSKLQRVLVTEAEQCSICQEELEKNVESIKLKCSHCFDIECIREWLKRQKVCPLCKEEI